MKGFVNNGNSCYFNVSLKALLTVCSDLVDYEVESEASTFTHLFFRLLKAYNDPDIQYIDPRPLLDVFREHYTQFTEHDQHDIQECILCLIDILERDLPIFKRRFYGLRENQVIHPEGKNVSNEVFSMYILESERNSNLVEQIKKSFKWNTIENYMHYNLATKRSLIRKIPEVFMISFDAKSETEVPEKMRIAGQDLELLFTGIHEGNQHGGHYGCLIKKDEQWILHDDLQLLHVQNFPRKCGHYVLIYSLKTPSS